MRTLFTDEAKARVKAAIAEVEKKTSAEIVVVVRRQSDGYREIDLMVGLTFAMAMLAVVLFHPTPFAVRWMPVDVAVAFLVGFLLSTALKTLKRALITNKRVEREVHNAACAVFVDKKMTRTRRRAALLVYVSSLEAKVELVADVGIDAPPVTALQSAVDRGDLGAFVTALGALAEPLAKQVPFDPDDVNELPDDVEAA
jgi:putative membrane protein